MFHAFLDDTASQHYHPNIVGVGGFVFSSDGKREFEGEWGPRIAPLPKPYRTALCAGGRYPFGPPEWPYEARQAFMRDLAHLTARTRDAGFIAFTHQDEYEVEVAARPEIVKNAGEPFALCLMACMDAICGYIEKNYPGERVTYWIEAGSRNESQAMEFLSRIASNEATRERFKLRDYGFYPKVDVPTLCAADLLCWEWQRNYVEAHREDNSGEWRETFKLLFASNKPKPIIPVRLSSPGIQIRGMIHTFYGLKKGD